MIIKATKQHLNIVVDLAKKLWHNSKIEELKSEYNKLLDNPNCLISLFFDGDSPVAFSQVQLRFDYVEGCCDSPVAYLEGIFVEENYRKRGIARQLIQKSENWAKLNNITEFASDCEYDNVLSEQMHIKLGFKEVNVIKCFHKKI